MKKSLLILVFLFSATLCFSQDIASCCTSPKDEGRCTGSAYCTACKNCSRCAHCGSGGTCGVCATVAEPEEPKKPRTRNKNSPSSGQTGNKARPNTAQNDGTAINAPAQFEAIADVNLRSGPGENFRIVDKIPKGAKLVKLSQRGAWSKVRVISSNKTGYVLSKYIR